jgi:NAD(P)-dependent dehydrogenase (short-subunit alcohol dehydrogenase family)
LNLRTQFAQAGGKVVVSDIKHCDETVAAIKKAGGTVLAIRADVSKTPDVEALLAQIVAAFGRLDVAVNNAGIEGSIKPFVEQDDENFDRVIATNLRSTFICMRAQVRQMLKVERCFPITFV